MIKKAVCLFFTLLILLPLTSFSQEIRSDSWRVTLEDAGYTLDKGTGDRVMQKEVRFSPPLESIPDVNIFVSYVDADKKYNFRYDVKALSISRDGFVLRIKTWSEGLVYAIGGYWLAEGEKLEIEEEEIEVGQTIRLNNISFEFNKADLLPSSYEELDKVYSFLNDNPTVQIELAGHTDNVGSDDYNMELSQKRADAVKTYLVNKGIDAGRLTSKGYGETKPIETNDQDWGREKNRRVEFTILQK